MRSIDFRQIFNVINFFRLIDGSPHNSNKRYGNKEFNLKHILHSIVAQ